ncbi:hypothetical protein J6590_052590 [Homalodisca vitripennis]|nr:hypothetical protein J6590_052590 [Homalodisca vitripennis]
MGACVGGALINMLADRPLWHSPSVIMAFSVFVIADFSHRNRASAHFYSEHIQEIGKIVSYEISGRTITDLATYV